MAIPTLASVTPGAGPASGGDLVRLVGTGFASERDRPLRRARRDHRCRS